ncbi:SDR family NAD(P)-dependent oxidoreductase [Caldanaerobius polysaccharolyticus]|uniref:SDR family NAD(P)-dependent oxidoreductase n=1 Tax=Caldanaerobius polysaccharolyticus TaxID=44256 RepID=UPI00047ACD3A|nr:SDR family NAD(P)-dependent oxidoreductase [Caldanaerobius polysaccharolyticus]
MNVVIIGANKGLGLCLVKIFAMRGHHVFAGVYGRDDLSRIEEVKEELSQYVDVIELDVSDELSVKEAAMRVGFAKNNAIDCLINCAGILLPGDRNNTISEMDIGELRKTLEINTIGTVNVIKHFLPCMRSDGQGLLLFITSEAGSVSHNGMNFPAYSISKAAANKAVFVLRATVGDKYKVYAVHPGRMNTDMGRTTAEIEPEESAESIYSIVTGLRKVSDNNNGFINYKGEPMDL